MHLTADQASKPSVIAIVGMTVIACFCRLLGSHRVLTRHLEDRYPFALLHLRAIEKERFLGGKALTLLCLEDPDLGFGDN